MNGKDLQNLDAMEHAAKRVIDGQMRFVEQGVTRFEVTECASMGDFKDILKNALAWHNAIKGGQTCVKIMGIDLWIG